MKKTQIKGLEFWSFENLEKEKGLKHYITTRGPQINSKEFTLSFSSSPDKEEIQSNRSFLASIFGIEERHLFFPVQVHKTAVVQVTKNTLPVDLNETDALITNEKGICLAVMSADCVPILLYDKKNHAIGAIHSGWRGTTAKILEKTLHEMHVRFGTTGEDIIAGIGPSVSQEAYEVGEEVIQEVNHAFGADNSLMILYPEKNKANLDLWHANKIQLLKFGVPHDAIEISDLCTVKNNNYFFSARKGDSGRFAAAIMLA